MRSRFAAGTHGAHLHCRSFQHLNALDCVFNTLQARLVLVWFTLHTCRSFQHLGVLNCLFPKLCRHDWRNFAAELSAAERAAAVAEGGFAFAFVEGQLVKAVRQGWWLLLDELNLAPPEVLERIAGARCTTVNVLRIQFSSIRVVLGLVQGGSGPVPKLHTIYASP